jgi:hypothetical protein
VVIVAAPAINWIDQHGRAEPVPGPHSLRVEAVVERVDGVVVDLAYDNPLTGQRVQTSAPRHGTLTAGDTVGIAVDPADPEHVRLAGDQPDGDSGLLAGALLLVLPGIWVAMRRWSVHAAEQVAAKSTVPSFAMVGALAPPRRTGRRPCLHLWPLDSPPDAEALCAVPVLITAGLPLGRAFPVEAKGSPRSFGRVVARASDTVLWPAARALRNPWLRRPDRVDEVPPWLPPAVTEQRSTPVPRDSRFVVVHAALILGFVASTVLLVVISTVTLVNDGRADRLYRDGTGVVAEITGRGASTVTVTYNLPGETTSRIGQVPVDWPEEEKIGLRLPAVVHPAHRDRLRFRRERYDAVEPITWAAIPFVAFTAVLFVQLRTWRRSARVAATGQWRTVTAHRHTRRGFTYLTIGGDAGTVLEVRLPLQSTWRLRGWDAGRPLRVDLAGEADPGSPIALRYSRRLLPVISPSLIPRTGRPDIPPPPHGARWPAPQPGTGPVAP